MCAETHRGSRDGLHRKRCLGRPRPITDQWGTTTVTYTAGQQCHRPSPQLQASYVGKKPHHTRAIHRNADAQRSPPTDLVETQCKGAAVKTWHDEWRKGKEGTRGNRQNRESQQQLGITSKSNQAKPALCPRATVGLGRQVGRPRPPLRRVPRTLGCPTPVSEGVGTNGSGGGPST